MTAFKKIILPTRPQVDTTIAIFLLKKFGESQFPGISSASVETWQTIPQGENESSLRGKGIFLIDVGGGEFDHHAKVPKTTSSMLISKKLGVENDPALAKLLDLAERDDFYGKGTISTDPLDRAFGLSGLIVALNKFYTKEPAKVLDVVMPLLEAHLAEENKRTKELPQEFQEKLKSGKAEVFSARQRKKKLDVVIIDSDNASMAGYLRSQLGGAFDVVAQWLSSGHLNILTRPAKRVDLRSLVALIRMEESRSSGKEVGENISYLASNGRIPEVPEWYYDTATNSIQNGGLNPKDVSPTEIPRFSFKKLIELGLSESLWSPVDKSY